MRTQITENEHVHEQWYKDAKKVTRDTLPDFVAHVMDDYLHDYGTYVHAVAACAIATAWACGRELSGFQASIVGLEFLLHWTYSDNKCGIRVIDWDDMLWPQYRDRFRNVIPRDAWKALKEEAENKSHGTLHPKVKAHLDAIAAGIVPFGYEVGE